MVNLKDVDVDSNEERDAWGLLNRNTLGHSVGLRVGVVSYKKADGEPDLGPAHDTIEVLYIVTGSGRIRLDEESLPLTAGDAILIPPGSPHTVWSTRVDPMQAVYFVPEN